MNISYKVALSKINSLSTAEIDADGDPDSDMIPNSIEESMGTDKDHAESNWFNTYYQVEDEEECVLWNKRDWSATTHNGDASYLGELSNPPYIGH